MIQYRKLKGAMQYRINMKMRTKAYSAAEVPSMLQVRLDGRLYVAVSRLRSTADR